jgi:hypothetical protein
VARQRCGSSDDGVPAVAAAFGGRRRWWWGPTVREGRGVRSRRPIGDVNLRRAELTARGRKRRRRRLQICRRWWRSGGRARTRSNRNVSKGRARPRRGRKAEGEEKGRRGDALGEEEEGDRGVGGGVRRHGPGTTRSGGGSGLRSAGATDG